MNETKVCEIKSQIDDGKAASNDLLRFATLQRQQHVIWQHVWVSRVREVHVRETFVREFELSESEISESYIV